MVYSDTGKKCKYKLTIYLCTLAKVANELSNELENRKSKRYLTSRSV